MNLSEIRPGDYVMIGDTRTTWKPEFYFRWDSTGRCPIGYSEGKNTSPLKLTYHFLKCNGFIDYNDLTTVLYTSSGSSLIEIFAEITTFGVELTIYKSLIDDDSKFEVKYCNEIKYVHELQHAFSDCNINNRLNLD